MRDNAAVTYQSQLDEVARGLIDAFKETDQSGAALPDVPGLFTYPGAPAMPATGGLGRPRRLDQRCRVGRSGPGRQSQPAARRRDQRQRGLPLQHHRQCRLLDGCSNSSTTWLRRSRSIQPPRQAEADLIDFAVVDELDRKPAQERGRQATYSRRCSTAAPRRCRTSAASTWTTKCR